MPELEARLRALADEVAWPATPDIAGAVARAPRERAPRRFAPHRRGTRRALAALLAALLLVPAAAVAFPGARAEREAGFAAALPAELGEADRVRVTGRRISLLYAAGPGLPQLDGVDAGLILTESRGGLP